MTTGFRRSAEDKGFEPSHRFTGLAHFECAPLNRLGNPPECAPLNRLGNPPVSENCITDTVFL